MKIKRIISRKPVKYCTPELGVSGAAKLMKTENVGALPVVDKKKKGDRYCH